MRPDVRTFVADGPLPDLIETAPRPVLTADPGPEAGEWQRRLYGRTADGEPVG